jgi:hypothetical protein
MRLFVGIGDAPATTGEQSLFAGCRNAKIFFVASAAANSAYLTVSEIFARDPISRDRNLILGTFAVGVFAPLIFGKLVGTGSRDALFGGIFWAQP